MNTIYQNQNPSCEDNHNWPNTVQQGSVVPYTSCHGDPVGYNPPLEHLSGASTRYSSPLANFMDQYNQEHGFDQGYNQGSTQIYNQ